MLTHRMDKDRESVREQHAIVRGMMWGNTGRILDLGCGDLPYRLREGESSITVDADRSVRPDVVADACALPFRADSFHRVVACGVIEHVDSPRRMLAEVGRVGMEGVVMTPNVARLRRVVSSARSRVVRERSGHAQGYDAHLLLGAVRAASLVPRGVRSRFVDLPLAGLGPIRRLGRWLSRRLPMLGSEIYVGWTR